MLRPKEHIRLVVQRLGFFVSPEEFHKDSRLDGEGERVFTTSRELVNLEGAIDHGDGFPDVPLKNSIRPHPAVATSRSAALATGFQPRESLAETFLRPNQVTLVWDL